MPQHSLVIAPLAPALAFAVLLAPTAPPPSALLVSPTGFPLLVCSVQQVSNKRSQRVVEAIASLRTSPRGELVCESLPRDYRCAVGPPTPPVAGKTRHMDDVSGRTHTSWFHGQQSLNCTDHLARTHVDARSIQYRRRNATVAAKKKSSTCERFGSQANYKRAMDVSYEFQNGIFPSNSFCVVLNVTNPVKKEVNPSRAKCASPIVI